MHRKLKVSKIGFKMKRVVGTISLVQDERFPQGTMESIIEMDKLRKKLKLVKNSYVPKAKFKYKMSSIEKAISRPIKKVKLPKILPSKNFQEFKSKISKISTSF